MTDTKFVDLNPEAMLRTLREDAQSELQVKLAEAMARALTMIADAPLFYPLIWVEGIIGAGKSRFTREVGRRLGLRVIEEPVVRNPYLDLFYLDPRTFAFSMQVWYMIERWLSHNLAADEATGVGGTFGAMVDRSLSGDRVFAEEQHRIGNISDLDWYTYKRIHHLVARTLLPPTLIVFLDARPETAFARVQERDRVCERAGVSLEYLRDLRLGYVRLMQEAERGLLPWSHAVRVSRIPWDAKTVTDTEWDHTAETIRDECRIIRA